MTAHISVVVPFYQKKAGILPKAVASALGQSGGHRVDIVIVDDASPVPARQELAQLMLDWPGRIVIIEQANAGPAAARNRALDQVDPGTDYVAFLDSDDEWIPEHLDNAVKVFEQGSDFYFADHYQLNQTVSAFARGGRIRAEEHAQIGPDAHLRAYRGDMFAQILMGNVIGTSTVVYRHRKFPALRFREEFVYAGEDYLFWLELSQQTDKIAFSSRSETIYGEGVNIFAGSGWGTEKSLTRIHYELKFKKALARLFTLNAAQLENNRQAIATLRKSFVRDVLHRLAHRKPLGAKLMAAHWKVDPQSFIYFVPLAVGLALRRN